MLANLGNGASPHHFFICLIDGWIYVGSGVTTSLVALIANAGPEDQAIATAGQSLSHDSPSI